jgi:regulatory protein
MRKRLSAEEATQKMERYCAYQERCHMEVKNKLASMGIFGHSADEVITKLIQNDYLNETRFAMQFARGKFRIKKWGTIRIRMELKSRNISNYNIQKALDQIDPIDYEKAFDQWAHQKWEHLAQTTSNTELLKRKWVRYFQYRGWENELIYKTVRTLETTTNKNGR